MSRRRKEGNCGRKTSCDYRGIGFIIGGERGLWRPEFGGLIGFFAEEKQRVAVAISAAVESGSGNNQLHLRQQ
ncbi:hypothetical protein RHSIM_Rhsim10G0169200 [Rhododendron simsii]|uniref:Uncharacterized protein n=1 Tax=Rhododendron simsii TaxID=118357 RepID=A0A834LBM7_RHOSS|nr:hypothetical protein RHSIM_Rhsim10G0169200 [Rhododendron simsii]